MKRNAGRLAAGLILAGVFAGGGKGAPLPLPPADAVPAAEKAAAVDRGLKWLWMHQEPDGHWDCGKHGGEAKPANDVAVTALAVLAFMGNGQTEDSKGPFGPMSRKAVYHLENAQANDGSFSKDNFAHAVATLAMSEAYGMTQKHKESAQRGINYLITQQATSGGWDVGRPGKKAATAITAWSIMAMKSGKLAGLEVPGDGFEKALKFLQAAKESVKAKGPAAFPRSLEEGKPTETGPEYTAMGMLGLIYLGMNPDHPWLQTGVEVLKKAGPPVGETMNIRHAYFAALAIFQADGKGFPAWDAAVAAPLLKLQAKEAGDAEGSFPPEKDPRGKSFGRVYTTAMACNCLEIHMRYQPTYALPDGER